MDREKLVALKALLNELIPDGAPSEQALDYDTAAVNMYAAMETLKDAMEYYGF